MSTQPRINNSNKITIQNILKKLETVKTSPDFEERLLRRIKEIEILQHKMPSIKILLRTKHIPAYAFSLPALITVNVISYFTFMKTKETPVSQNQDPRYEIGIDKPVTKEKHNIQKEKNNNNHS